jgi:phage-related protein
MTQPIDTAYVDIVVRDKSLDKLEKDIQKSFKKIDKAAEKDLKHIDQDFDDAFKEIDKHFADMVKTAEDNFDELNDIVENSMGEINVDVDSTVSHFKKRFKGIGDSIGDEFDDIEDKIDGPIRRSFIKLGGIISGIGGVLGQLGSSIGGAVSSSPLLALILILTPAIIALAAALSQLIGLVGILPSGLAVVLTAIIPVIVAFQNFGDAVGAIASGDVEKINEALKKLSPSAAFVAREIGAMLPNLRAFQRLVQETFFREITGDFTKVIRAIFPTMEKGFTTVTAAVGRLISGFADLIAHADTIQVFRELFASTGRIIDKLAGPFTRFAEMLLSTVHESLPFVERLATAFGKALDTFSAFVNKSIETDDFDQFIEDAITTVKELIDLGKALGALIGTIFAGTETSGHELLKTLTDMVTQITEFLKTEDGIKTLELMSLAVQAFGAILLTSAQTMVFFGGVFFNMMTLLEGIGRGFVVVMSTIIDWVTLMKDTLVNDFNNVVFIITHLPEIISGLAPKFLSAGKNLINSFMNGFRSVGSFIGDIAGDIVNSVKGFLNKAIDRINSGITVLDNVLPGSLGRIPRLADGGIFQARPGGGLAVLGEGGSDEAVIPLDKLDEVLGKKPGDNGAMTINFSAGSINVNFSGTVPTEAEAKTVGKAVGQGIIDMISKRNMRAQVRAV